MKKIIYTRPQDNGLSVVYPVPKKSIEEALGKELTQAEYEQHVWERSVPVHGLNPRYVEDSELPENDEFRDAWKDDGNALTHDFNKAKDIQLLKLRTERNDLLTQYDKKINALEDSSDDDGAKKLKSKRQELRDITNSLKALQPKSIDEIKEATPSLDDYNLDSKLIKNEESEQQIVDNKKNNEQFAKFSGSKVMDKIKNAPPRRQA